MKIADGNQTFQSKHSGSGNDCGAGPLQEKPPLAAPAQNQGVGVPQVEAPHFSPLLPGQGSPSQQDQVLKDDKHWEFLVGGEKGRKGISHSTNVY